MTLIIKVTNIISPDYLNIIPGRTYNFMINQNGVIKDIRGRVISKTKNKVLILKLQD